MSELDSMGYPQITRWTINYPSYFFLLKEEKRSLVWHQVRQGQTQPVLETNFNGPENT
jgi:hypothetical protein